MNTVIYFLTFLKASLLSTGGLGNLPFLHQDLLALGWAQPSDFVTAIAVGNVSPGPTGLWSVSLGYLTNGWTGAVLALVALSIPPLSILAVAAFYNRIEHRSIVQDFTRGLSLGVVGLTLAVALGLASSEIADWRGVALAVGALVLALTNKIPVIVILLLAGIAGGLLFAV